MDATHERRLTKHIHISVKKTIMNTRYVLTLCTALVVGGALITGSANALGKADEKTPINDSWLTAKTKIALFADARIKGSEINVETSQGSVMIRGEVDSDAAKQAAEGIAKGIDGVKSVKNDLQVIAPLNARRSMTRMRRLRHESMSRSRKTPI